MISRLWAIGPFTFRVGSLSRGEVGSLVVILNTWSARVEIGLYRWYVSATVISSDPPDLF